MMKIAISPAATALLRALIARAAVERNRILLTDAHSTDWQSLTFTGERHHLSLRVTGVDSGAVAERMCAGLEDAEFSIPGVLVADIATVGSPRGDSDGATELVVEALTISED
jgi:hypothetical protein